jgi:hypothetical protein
MSLLRKKLGSEELKNESDCYFKDVVTPNYVLELNSPTNHGEYLCSQKGKFSNNFFID